MKTRYIFKWIGFLSNLRSKIAHKTCQIRASSHMEEKIKFSKDLILFERENFCIQEEVFFHSFYSHSSLYKYPAHCTTQRTKTLALTTTLIFLKILQSCDFRTPISSKFQGVLAIQTCSWGSQGLVPVPTRSQDCPEHEKHKASIWYFSQFRFLQFMHY